ncbi:MAG: alanine--glyoxylate aminotransferase family protein [Actinomycetia bacterium]|nr:alanine--glyoxylate aminotransferase family protein [Actinomycetes bacterium]MCP3911227.1 alanine--glyoxylate aminotransferase family protein [Actinomycetes bacterium]
MSLSQGRPMVAIPGPSIIPDRVLSAMNRPMPNIYDGELLEISDSLLADLPTVARTSGHTFITVSNGHGAWAMALTNTLSRGDKVLVLESGRFAIGWGEMAQVSGVEMEVLAAESDRVPVDPAAVEERLRADTGHEIDAILCVQVDTANSVRNDIAAIGRAIESAGHPALFMVDCIASMGCEHFEMDDWGVDVTVAASQKGMMVPPGLGFVWANDKALAAHQNADLRSGYWDWTARMDHTAHYLRYAGTPPVQSIFGLREALDMIAEEGIENVWARHEVLAGAVREAVRTWATPGGFELNIGDPNAHANSTTTILTGSIDADRLRQVCSAEAGLTLGLGIGEFGGRAFRIGHMGHLNPPMILGTLGTIEASLAAMGAPTGGSGVAAAAGSVATAMKG